MSSIGPDRTKVNKRVRKDILEALRDLPASGIHIAPEKDNYFNIHYIFAGPDICPLKKDESPFKGGFYHGMIRLNDTHPGGPPSLYMFTENGRYQTVNYSKNITERGICTTFSSYHPENWSAARDSLGSATLSLYSFMLDLTDKNDKTGKSMPHGHAGSFHNITPENVKKTVPKALKAIKNDLLVEEMFPEIHKHLHNGTLTYQKFKKLTPSKYIDPILKNLKIERHEVYPQEYVDDEVESKDNKSNGEIKSKKKEKKIEIMTESESDSEEEIKKTNKEKKNKKIISESESDEEQQINLKLKEIRMAEKKKENKEKKVKKTKKHKKPKKISSDDESDLSSE
jgi:ubiquitin-protein ligase